MLLQLLLARHHRQQTQPVESLSERKSRLERLDRMQEDLMKDLQRREARKEEARKDRRLMKQQRDSRKTERSQNKVLVELSYSLYVSVEVLEMTI